jgi:hypothetical protein
VPVWPSSETRAELGRWEGDTTKAFQTLFLALTKRLRATVALKKGPLLI